MGCIGNLSLWRKRCQSWFWDKPAGCPGMTRAVRTGGSFPSAGGAVTHYKPVGEGTSDLGDA